MRGNATMVTRGICFTLQGFTLVITYALLVKESTGGKVILILLSLMCLLLIMTTECRFEYIKQPPSYAQSTLGEECTPYMLRTSLDARIEILLECVVRMQAGINDSTFEIRWFKENTTGVVEDLGRGDPDMAVGSNGWFSRYHDTKLFNQQYNPSFSGKYWCQVINTTVDPDQPLMRSNVFTLLPPDNYTGLFSCSLSASVQVVVNLTCADLPVHSEFNSLHVDSVTTHLPHLG